MPTGNNCCEDFCGRCLRTGREGTMKTESSEGGASPNHIGTESGSSSRRLNPAAGFRFGEQGSEDEDITSSNSFRMLRRILGSRSESSSSSSSSGDSGSASLPAGPSVFLELRSKRNTAGEEIGNL